MFSRDNRTETRSQEPSHKTTPKRERIQLLAGVGVLAVVSLLLGWGLSAMQWTVLSTNDNLTDAVAYGQLGGYSHAYSIPQGVEQDIHVGLYFATSSGGYSTLSGPDGSFFHGLPVPVSNSTTTSNYYASFSMTNPNGSAVIVWYSGPNGNVTQVCGAPSQVKCFLSPTPPGSSTGPASNFFLAPTAGNYTLHLLSTQCSPDYNYCTSTNATVKVTWALSSVTYNRPYYISGLATVIVGGVSIAAAVLFLGRLLDRRRKRYERWHRAPVSGPLPGLD